MNWDPNAHGSRMITSIFSPELRTLSDGPARSAASVASEAPFFSIGDREEPHAPAPAEPAVPRDDIGYGDHAPAAPEAPDAAEDPRSPFDFINAVTVEQLFPHVNPEADGRALAAPAPASEPDEGECGVCCENFGRGAGRKTQCGACNVSACAWCILRHHERDGASELFPKCVGCGEAWPLGLLARSVCAGADERARVGRTVRARVVAGAIARETGLLPSTATAAATFRKRRVLIEMVNGAIFASQLAQSNTVVARLCGARAFTVEPLGPPQPEIVLARPGDPDLLGIEAVKNVFVGAVGKLLREVFETPETEEARGKMTAVALMGAALEELLARGRAPQRMRAPDVADWLAGAFCKLVTDREGVARERAQQRINALRSLHAFVYAIPCEWWAARNLDDVAGILFSTAALARFKACAFTRSMFPRPPESALVSSSGTVAERACFNAACRGFMFKAEAARSERGPALARAAAAAAERRAGVGAAERFELKCQLCGATACFECHHHFTSDGESASHTCVAETVATMRFIRETTRACPRCKERISRTEGCRHMFCVRCGQPYDWETSELHISNTNPEYHSWITRMRESAGTGSGASDTESLRQIFSAHATGEDGLTTVARMGEIMRIITASGMLSTAAVLKQLIRAEEFITVRCISSLPSPAEFERLRIDYLTDGMSEQRWRESVGAMELRAVLAQKLIAALSKFVGDAMEAIRAAHREIETLPRTATQVDKSRIEARALATAAEAAVAATDYFSIAFATTKRNTAAVQGLFPRAQDFCQALAADRANPSAPASRMAAAQASMLNGGHKYGSRHATEAVRVASIFVSPIISNASFNNI
jgi:hypothetical protein